jgi:hypothetical protein
LALTERFLTTHPSGKDMSLIRIPISSLDRVDVIRALWTNAQLPHLPQDPHPMTRERGEEVLAQHSDGHFDYIDDRSIKVRFHGDELDVSLYDKDHGEGKALAVILALLLTGSVCLL